MLLVRRHTLEEATCCTTRNPNKELALPVLRNLGDPDPIPHVFCKPVNKVRVRGVVGHGKTPSRRHLRAPHAGAIPILVGPWPTEMRLALIVRVRRPARHCASRRRKELSSTSTPRRPARTSTHLRGDRPAASGAPCGAQAGSLRIDVRQNGAECGRSAAHPIKNRRVPQQSPFGNVQHYCWRCERTSTTDVPSHAPAIQIHLASARHP